MQPGILPARPGLLRDGVDLPDRLPEDCSLEEIQYHLYVRQMIEEGRREIREGHYFTQEQIEHDLAQWLAK